METPTRLGELLIYKQQRTAIYQTMECFSRKEASPILIAQPQQGKTTVCMGIVDKFLNDYKDKRCQIIYVINISDNTLLKQTEKRRDQAGLNFDVIHHSNIKNYHIDEQADYRLIILDECHVALGKDRPLDEFLKRCGIDYGNPIVNWQNQNNFVLSVSATPYAHVIASKLEQNIFEPVVLGRSQEYYCMQDMRNHGRLRQNKEIVLKDRITPFFDNRLKEFLNLCEMHGVGHGIIRAKGKKADIIEKFILDYYPWIKVTMFSNQNKNLPDLDDHLSTKYPHPWISIIKGTLRAGKTLKTTKYIRMWIDSVTGNADTVCQVIGRCCGYKTEDGHSKFDDNFPFYCNTKEITDVIDFYEKYENMPSGINNSNTKVYSDDQTKKITLYISKNSDELVKTKAKEYKWPYIEIEDGLFTELQLEFDTKLSKLSNRNTPNGRQILSKISNIDQNKIKYFDQKMSLDESFQSLSMKSEYNIRIAHSEEGKIYGVQVVEELTDEEKNMSQYNGKLKDKCLFSHLN